MRKLERSNIPEPQCLPSYEHGRHTWNDLEPKHKDEIRVHLELLQGRRCAYCEGALEELGDHIEHFRTRKRFPKLTFSWRNLYWSCDKTDSCGHFKDNGAGSYDPDDLIDPCCDDPDVYFLFRANGTISIRSGLTERQQRKASETLRVFSLDPEWGRLRKMRMKAVFGYVEDANAAIEEGFGVAELHAYFRDELRATEKQPFATAIRHVLTER
ncbi:retron system putative HNH endonuclease [Microvirga sp. RSM25]|uniref:retron system putative HNH endonuclease n=1 Tax=Microvirga sp. RSM25 TaxID=3273802 RepID=UPI00384BC275